MESVRILEGRSHALRKEFFTALLASGLCAFLLVAVILLMRRLAGALVQPLGGISLLAVASCGVLLAFGWRAGWVIKGRAEAVPLRQLMRREFWRTPVPTRGRNSLTALPLAIPGMAVFMLLCVLSLPGTPGWALMLTWLGFLVCETGWWWLAYLGTKTPHVARPTEARSAAAILAPPAMTALDEEEIEEVPLPDSVFQQVTRSRDGDLERIAAHLRVEFAAGQRLAVAHVAFCPPLATIPDVAVEVTDGPDAAVNLTLIQPFGLRLEVRLEEPLDEPCEVTMEIIGGTKDAAGYELDAP